jgi:homoserine dehydrogenase
MKKINIFCFGFGQVDKSLIRKLSSEKTEINLFTTSREETKKKKIDKLVYDNFKFDEKNYDKLLIKDLEKSDYILV